MPATLARLYRYPVKGLGAEALTTVSVTTGDGIPGDRRFAIARGSTAFDDTRPQWLRKQSFVMLMRDGDERLATLACAYEHDGRMLTVTPPGGASCGADLSTAEGRAVLSRVLNGHLGPRPDGAARVVSAGTLSLTDIPQNGLSIVNLASVADFAKRIGRDVDPLRFRANAYVEGLPAWAERAWIGGTIHAGEVALRINANIERCNATQVDPATGDRDLETVRLLRAQYGHFDMGVYGEVVRGGRLAVGSPIAPPASTGGTGRFGRAVFYAKNGWILLRSRFGL